MLSRNILLFILIVISIESIAQLKLEIKEIKVSKWITHSSSEISSHQDKGPYLLFTNKIINNSDKEVTLMPASAKFLVRFNYLNKNYHSRLFPLAFMDNDEVVLNSNDSLEFTAGLYLFEGQSIFEDSKQDYTLELLQILPTISFQFRDDNDNKLLAKGANSILLNRLD